MRPAGFSAQTEKRVRSILETSLNAMGGAGLKTIRQSRFCGCGLRDFDEKSGTRNN
jgi:hypothetical protein